MASFKARRAAGNLAMTLLACVLNVAAQALPLPLRSIDLGDGLAIGGTLIVDDVDGQLVDWRVAVRSTTRLAHFTRSNTAALAIDQVTVSADGRRLSVASSPYPAQQDGGILAMRSARPTLDFGAVLADFTGANALGGQASYMIGGAFDFLALGEPAGVERTVANETVAGSRRYELAPLAFDDGVTLSGHLLTDGTLGALGVPNLLGWDIFVDQIFEDVFDPSNSTMSASLLAFDAGLGALLVANPNGALSFNKPALGGRAHAVLLADFTDPQSAQGKAAYYQGRLAFYERELGAPRGAWRVTGNDAVTIPEPTSLALCLVGWLLCVGYVRRRR